MRFFASVILVLLVAAGMLAQEAPQTRHEYAATSLSGDTLQKRFLRWGDAILIEDVMINGKGPFRFILDTGAQGAGRIDRALVDRLQLPAIGSSTGVGPLGQQWEMTRHRVDSLAIGNLTFTDVGMSSRDYNADLPPGLRPIHGILGYHLFREYLLTINYPARTITAAKGELPRPDGKRILPVVGDDDDPQIEVSIGDRAAKALIDTGSMGNLVVPASLAKELKFTSEPTLRGREAGVELRSATLDGVLRIGAIEIANPNTVIATTVKEANLGIRALTSLSLTFDQKNKRIAVERPPERKRYGFTLARRGAGPWEFKGVAGNSIAETAGLRSSDRVIAINGTPLEQINREDMFQWLDASPITLQIEREGKRQEVRMRLE